MDLLPENKRIKLKKKKRILWIKSTGEIYCEVEDDTEKSTTETRRKDVDYFEANTLVEIENKVKEESLKPHDIPGKLLAAVAG